MTKTALIIDTATPNLYVLITKDGQILAKTVLINSLKHSEMLTTAVADTLRQADITMNDVDIYATNVGTGSFTGIRIGVATIKGYLVANDKPTVAVNTLQLLSYVKGEHTNSLMDAGRDLFYYAEYDRQELFVTPRLIERNQAEELLTQPNSILYNDQIDLSQALCDCVADKINNNDFTPNLEPIYLRKPQAQEDYEKDLVEILDYNSTMLDDLAEIENICFGGEAWTRSMIDSGLSNVSNTILLAIRQDKHIVAYTIFAYADDYGEISTIGVLPQYRRRGYGSLMMEKTIIKAKNMGIKQITLDVSTNNTKAIAMYQKLGFVIVGVRKNYYTNSIFGSNDAYVMLYQIK